MSDATDEPVIVLVEDDEEQRVLLERRLTAAGYRTEDCESGEAGLELLQRVAADVVLLDLNMPGIGGVETLRRLRARHPLLPVIILTAEQDVDVVVETMQAGAYDYLVKPPEPTRLLTTVRNAAERSAMSQRLQALEPDPTEDQALIGRSPAMGELTRQIRRLASTDVSVYLRGESGSGKELVARAIHERSGRSSAPLVAVNCAAIPESLQESELFGHEKGAFTGAEARRVGRFEEANGGTLFLDEVGELSTTLQAKLLRVLQERTFRRVGGSADLTTDFRLLVATHKDLQEEVAAGRFRADLYYRVVVYELTLPPLRERAGDIALLARRFLERFAPDIVGSVPDIDPAALALLDSHNWPGNVRELMNAIQRALVSCDGEQVRPRDLPPLMQQGAPADDARAGNAVAVGDPRAASAPVVDGGRPEGADGEVVSLAEIERTAILEAMERFGGNRSLVAQRLGIGRTTLYRKLREYGVDD